MNYKKTFNFLKSLPAKLNSFYKKKSKSGIKVNNKSKSVIYLNVGFNMYWIEKTFKKVLKW